MTRAMRSVYHDLAEQRRLHGVDSYGQASRFVGEIPEELLEEVRPRVGVSLPRRWDAFASRAGGGRVRLGARRTARQFGGRHPSTSRATARTRACVSFERRHEMADGAVKNANLEPCRSP